MMRVRWCVVLLGGLALAGGCSDDDAGVADASVSDDASPADGGDAGDAGSECPAGFQDNDGDGECAPDCGAAGLTCGAMAVCTDGSAASYYYRPATSLSSQNTWIMYLQGGYFGQS